MSPKVSKKIVDRIGWLASFLAILMFFSYLDQIRLNLAGRPGSILLPAATVVNCLAWFSYGFLKEEKDWPIMACNFLGFIVGLVTVFTALFA